MGYSFLRLFSQIHLRKGTRMQLLKRFRQNGLFLGILIGAVLAYTYPDRFATPALAQQSLPGCVPAPALEDVQNMQEYVNKIVGEPSSGIAPVLMIEEKGEVGVISSIEPDGSSSEALATPRGTYLIHQYGTIPSLQEAVQTANDINASSNIPAVPLQVSTVTMSVQSGTGTYHFVGILASGITVAGGGRMVFPINPLDVPYPGQVPSQFAPCVLSAASGINTVLSTLGIGIGNLMFSPNTCPPLGGIVPGGGEACLAVAASNYNSCVCRAGETFKAAYANCMVSYILALFSCLGVLTLVGTIACIASLAAAVACTYAALRSYDQAIEACKAQLVNDNTLCVLQM